MSQRPDTLRHPSQAKEQLNGLTTFRGVQKRPPTQHLAELSASTSASVFRHQIIRSADEKYLLVIQNGTLKVFNALTGAEEVVSTPGGTGYLSSPSDYRAVTIGDKTYLVNRTVAVRKGTTLADLQVPEAIVWVRQADYSTTYTINLNGDTVTYTTPEGTDPKAREAISTDNIAGELYRLLQATKFTQAGFSVTQYGSSLYITRTLNRDFTLTVSDGLADRGLVAVKGSVQSFDELPYKAKNGMIVEVVGDRSSAFDNYWVQFDDSQSPGENGVWRECPQPGTTLSLDATTMPHVLTFGGSFMEHVEVAEPVAPAVNDGEQVESGLPIDTMLQWATLGDLTGPDTVTAITAVPTADKFVESEQLGYGTAIGSHLSAGEHDVTMNFHVDTALVDPGVRTYVEVWYKSSAAASWLLFDYESFDAGQVLREHAITLQDLTVGDSGAMLGLRVRYASTTADDDEPTRFRRARVRINAEEHERPGFSVPAVEERSIATAASERFPKGTLVAITADGNTVSYTVSNDEDTWATIGAALAASLNALLGIAASFNTDTIVVSAESGGEAPVVTLSLTYNASGTQAWLRDLASAMTPNEHVGRLVTNSDGSTGLITANTAHTLTVAALTGGSANAFRRGDFLSITAADPDAFTFGPAEWADRQAGSLTSVPFPSFVGRRIVDVFFTEGRLWFLSDASVVGSQAGDPLNVFRRTVQQLLPDDPIDITAATPDTTTFHTARLFDESVFLWSGLAQYRLSGTPVMTPTTVRLDKVSSFENTAACPPCPMGDRLLFATPSRTSWARVLAYRLTETGAAADDTTMEVPEYIPKDIIGITGSTALGLLFALTASEVDTLYVYSFLPAPDGSMVYAGWSTWEFPGATIVGIEVLDDTLQLVVVRDGARTCLEKIELAVKPGDVASYKDRIGWSGGTVFYDFRYVPTRFCERDDRGTPESRGRLQLGRVTVLYTDTEALDAEVSLSGRDAREYSVSNATPANGEFTFPVMGNADDAEITLSLVDDEGPVVINGFSWEGRYHIRRRRI